jgi:hypothetical protein
MAELFYNPAIEKTEGALSKHGLITRQKIYRDAHGRIISYGKQEGYYMVHPRNFKRHPMRGKELEHHNLWRDICHQAKDELADPERRAQWELRFNAQLPFTKGTHPDPQAPTDKTTGAKKRYVQLYAFTRAMLYQAHIAQQ